MTSENVKTILIKGLAQNQKTIKIVIFIIYTKNSLDMYYLFKWFSTLTNFFNSLNQKSDFFFLEGDMCYREKKWAGSVQPGLQF